MIYIPIDNFDNTCVNVIDKDTVRVINTNDDLGIYSYTDYFVNSHYLSKEGFLTDISSYSCSSNITNLWYYRNDVADIFLMCFIGALFFFGIPLIIFRRFFKKH